MRTVDEIEITYIGIIDSDKTGSPLWIINGQAVWSFPELTRDTLEVAGKKLNQVFAYRDSAGLQIK